MKIATIDYEGLAGIVEIRAHIDEAERDGSENEATLRCRECMSQQNMVDQRNTVPER